MKKILSLCLAVVMLLGMVAMTASAEETAPAFDGYYVSLGDDISLNFSLVGLTPGQSYEVEVTDGTVGDTITVVADADGSAVARYTGLTPAMLDTKFTATVVIDENTTLTATKSVMDYCKWALNNMDLSNDVHALVVDLIVYAAASQMYLGAEEEETVYAGLTELQDALATGYNLDVTNLPEWPTVNQENANYNITWIWATPVLGESIAYRFYFTPKAGVNVEECYFSVKFDGEYVDQIPGAAAQYDITDDAYYVDFTALTPADLGKDVEIALCDENGTEISAVLPFSAERYASWAFNASEVECPQSAKVLIYAMLAYGKGAQNYNAVAETNPEHLFANEEKRDLAASALTNHEIYRLANVKRADYVKADETFQLLGYADWVYKHANIDVSRYINTNVSAAQSLLFTSTFSHELKEVDDDNKYLNAMMMCDRADLIPPKEDLKIGDLFCYRYYGPTSKKNENIYFIALYQGDNFLVHTTHRDYMTELTIESYEDIVKLMEEKNLETEQKTCFFALRPENAINVD